MNYTESLGEYYEKSYDTLVKRVSGKAGGPYNAEDVVQEAFSRALKYKGTFDKDRPMDNWFSRILQNSLKDFLQEQRNYGMNMVSEEVDAPSPISPENGELCSHVREHIKKFIPENEKEILTLYYLKGYSLQDVARITDEKYRRVNYVVYKFDEELKKGI